MSQRLEKFGLQDAPEKTLGSFFSHAIRCAFKWLNRRGGKRSSFNWAEFNVALEKLNIAKPRIVEKQRQHVVFA
jgi:RNA-directed DNA polymerase